MLNSLPSQEASPQPFSREVWARLGSSMAFPFAMWFLSRTVIVATMVIITLLNPNLPNGNQAWLGPQLFSYWDSGWYHSIVDKGYEYAPDGKEHSVAFFPLFPLAVWGVMKTGLSFLDAGLLVANLSFLVAVLLLFHWMRERYGHKTAQWITAALVWCPLSLFGTVIYTEGLFLLLTTAALRAFDKGHHFWAAVWGALASATRVTGAMLVPGMLLIAWKEKRGLAAYVAALCCSLGILAFATYCMIRFGDPLAFLQAQKGWGRGGFGFDWDGWLKVLSFGLIGPVQNGDGLIKAVMVFGGGVLLWKERAKLPPVATAFGACALGMVLLGGNVHSIERHAFSIVTLAMAFGLYFRNHLRWGALILAYFGLILAAYSLQFAQQQWVA